MYYLNRMSEIVKIREHIGIKKSITSWCVVVSSGHYALDKAITLECFENYDDAQNFLLFIFDAIRTLCDAITYDDFINYLDRQQTVTET